MTFIRLVAYADIRTGALARIRAARAADLRSELRVPLGVC